MLTFFNKYNILITEIETKKIICIIRNFYFKTIWGSNIRSMDMKKGFCLFLFTCIMFSILTTAPVYGATSGTCGENISWSYNRSVLTISGTGEMPDFGKTISDNAPWFSCAVDAVSIIIENGVTSIGANAFYYAQSITSISFPDSVTKIGNSAFEECMELTNVDFGNVNEIGNRAFAGCNIAKLDFTNVTTIGDNAFSNCFNLTKVTLGDSVTTIGNEAFSACIKLSSVSIGKNVSFIGNEAFYSTGLRTLTVSDDNTHYTAIDNVLFDINKTRLIKYPEYKNAEGYVIWDTVTEITDYAFSGNGYLMGITIPASVTKIGDYAFSGCKSLANVYYSGSESSWNAIETGSNNTLLTNANIYFTETPSNITWAFDNGVLTVNGTGEISDYLYENPAPWSSFSESITKIVIEEGITGIGTCAFATLSNAVEIFLPSTVKAIGNAAFSDCPSLSEIKYNGTRADFQSITIGTNNEYFNNCTVKYTSVFVFYDANGGEDAPESIEASPNSQITISDEIPVRADYTFAGWSTSATETENILKPSDILVTGTEDITLYAVWKLPVTIETNIVNNIFLVSAKNVPEGSMIIFACYKNKEFSQVIPYTYTLQESIIPFAPTEDYDDVKIMVWKDLTTMTPLCAPVTPLHSDTES